MHIKKITFYKATIELKEPFITSLGSEDFSSHIFVKVLADNGQFGWGECAPYQRINTETIETCLVVAPLLVAQLIGVNPCAHEEILKRMNTVIYGNESIKSAIDIACYDLAAKNAKVPLYAYLGGAVQKKLYTDYTVSIDTVEKMVAAAKKIKDRGFTIVKVKLGDNGEKDVERIREIRKAIGDELEIRIDANQGWGVNEAIETLSQMSTYQIQYCEAPINKNLAFRLKEVKEKSPIPIMADESLFNHYDAQMLTSENHCDAFNLKLGKTGGICEALKIVEIAEKNKIPMQFGGFVETKIVFTANCHIAHTSDWIKYSDFDSPLFHKIDPIIGGMEYQKDWEIFLPDAPGLGLLIKEEFLEQCEKFEFS